MGFGSRLRELREKLGISQDELAERASTKLASIQNWEQERFTPRLKAIGLLAQALGVKVGTLLEFDSTVENKRPRGRPTKPDQPRSPQRRRQRRSDAAIGGRSNTGRRP